MSNCHFSLVESVGKNLKFFCIDIFQNNSSYILPGAEVDEAEIEDLFDQLEDLSDSGPEVDTISITSTPKPSLRPYFSSSRSLLNEG